MARIPGAFQTAHHHGRRAPLVPVERHVGACLMERHQLHCGGRGDLRGALRRRVLGLEARPLNRFIHDFYSRRRATVAENWSRSLRFLSTELANASFRSESRNVALLAAGGARDELQVARVILRIQPNPQQPHSATADFDLVRMEMANEVSRERWTLSLQFLFLEEIPPDLIVFNPMGIIISYLQGDRATVTGDQ